MCEMLSQGICYSIKSNNEFLLCNQHDCTTHNSHPSLDYSVHHTNTLNYLNLRQETEFIIRMNSKMHSYESSKI